MFFYGLFMDANLLRGKGVRVLESRVVRLDDYWLRIGARATLVSAKGQTVHGILMRVPAEDLQQLYSDPSVNAYVAHKVKVTSSDGEPVEAICYNLPEAFPDFETNPAYARELHDLATKLGFPPECLAAIMPSLSFRKALRSEAALIAALVNSSYRGESSKQGWTTEADLLDGTRTNEADIESLIAQEGSLILLCTEGTDMIGCAHLELLGAECQLGMLVIRPGLQSRGIGKQLMQAAEAVARETWAVTKITMSVISVRQELIAFYERRGYRRTGRRRPFVADDTHGFPKSQPIEFEVLEKTLQ